MGYIYNDTVQATAKTGKVKEFNAEAAGQYARLLLCFILPAPPASNPEKDRFPIAADIFP